MGGVVFGVGYACDFKSAKYFCAKCDDDLRILRGSKYISSSKTVTVDGKEISVFALVAEYLSKGFPVLFIGLGCDVAAVLTYCHNKNINIEKLYTMDLICHGPTFPSVQAQYVESLENRFKSKVVDFSVRYKKKMVKPPYVHAVFENGRVFTRPFYETDFGFAFNNYSRASCFACKYKGEAHRSDITVGDYWGVEENEEDSIKNPLGVSIMFVHSSKGDSLIRLVNLANFEYKRIAYEDAIKKNPMYYSCLPKSVDQDFFSSTFPQYGLKQTVRMCNGYKTFIKRRVKNRLYRALHFR